MARIFTIQFQYNTRQYEALVTVIPAEDTTTFHVKVLDMGLHVLLPGGQLYFEGGESLQKNSKVKDRLTLALVSCISAAIEKHLANME